MSHLSHEQLSAHADGALTGRELERAVSHIAGCPRCRAELDRIVLETRDLGRALTHDPGEQYFASFADRVAERIAGAPAGAKEPLPAPRVPWWSSPRVLAWSGAAAAVVGGVAIALVIAREPQVDLARRALAPGARHTFERTPPAPATNEATGPAAGTVAPPPAPASAPEEKAARANAPSPVDERRAARERDALKQEAMSQPQRAYEVRRTPEGEDVAVNPPRFPTQRKQAAAPAPGPPYRVIKPTQAQPLAGQSVPPAAQQDLRAPAATQQELSAPAAPTPAVAKLQGEVRADATTGRLCGEVRDPFGRAVAGAQVVLSDLGTGTTTDRDGHFCLDAPADARSLTVLAVGYEPLRRDLDAGAPVAALTLEVHPVAVLDRPLALGGRAPAPPTGVQSFGSRGGAPTRESLLRAPGEAPAMEAALAPFAQETDTVRALARGAQRMLIEAAGTRSAGRYDAVAGEWGKVLRHARGDAAVLEARRRIAEARYRAWDAAPTEKRALAAEDALTAFLVRAPGGLARRQAVEWLDRVKQ